jgi:FlaA1/EpsC-like NDP-sugar epimerase
MIYRLLNATRTKKRIISLCFDTLAILLAMHLAYCLRLGVVVPHYNSRHVYVASVVILASLYIFARFGMYRAVLRYLSAPALASIALCALISATLLASSSFFIDSYMPRSVPLIYGVILFLFIGTPRLLVRSIVHLLSNRMIQRTPIVIYGAGQTGHKLLVALQSTQYKVVAFVDDNPLLVGTTLAGVKVRRVGSLNKMVARGEVTKVLLALGNASFSQRAGVIKKLEPLGVEVQTVPDMADIVNGDTRIEQIKDVAVEDLLGRDPVKPNPQLMDACIKNKVVMVTGAGGSIGSELCRQIIKLEPKKLILFELNEFGLYAIERELQKLSFKNPVEIIPLLGSVQNRSRLESAMGTFNVQTVYHAAAYKHVPLVEQNIIEGIRNNIFGTWNCAEAAITCNVESFVLISTDKAVRPTNIMGASKRMAELVLQALADRQNKTRFTMVRFGNVLGSSGSVVPLFRQQIKSGGPVTVTHPDIIRYFMTIPEAAELVIQAGSMGQGGDVFVLDMGDPVKIVDLAKRMIKLSGLSIKRSESSDGDIQIVFTGLRPGEKLYEELLIGDNVSGTGHPRIMRAQEVKLNWLQMKEFLDQLDRSSKLQNCEIIKRILLMAPTGYSSQDKIHDQVWTNHIEQHNSIYHCSVSTPDQNP